MKKISILILALAVSASAQDKSVITDNGNSKAPIFQIVDGPTTVFSIPDGGTEKSQTKQDKLVISTGYPHPIITGPIAFHVGYRCLKTAKLSY